MESPLGFHHKYPLAGFDVTTAACSGQTLLNLVLHGDVDVFLLRLSHGLSLRANLVIPHGSDILLAIAGSALFLS